MDVVVIPRKFRKTRKRDRLRPWEEWRENVAPHTTFRRGRRGKHRGRVQALVEGHKI